MKKQGLLHGGKLLLGGLVGYGAHTLLLNSTLVTYAGFNVLIQEGLLASLSVLLGWWGTGVGMALADAGQLLACTAPVDILLRMPLLLIPHLLLTNLYATRQKPLLGAALFLAASWQLGRNVPALLWLPATAFTFALLWRGHQKLFQTAPGGSA